LLQNVKYELINVVLDYLTKNIYKTIYILKIRKNFLFFKTIS
jgi:hypothetical protein